uniref:Uncharacterized protein n=1 Tax=Parastrongyloides trichosuri TaxID=131310 RepID=A0A0N4ZZS3_PARTI
MIKKLLLVLSIIILLNEFCAPEKLCNGEDFILGFKGEFLCQGKPSKTAKFYVNSCNSETGDCDRTSTTTSNIIGKFFGSSTVKGSNDEFELHVYHDCAHCGGASSILFSTNDGVNCEGSLGKTHDFGKIELTDPLYC